jgi:16S rRNA processing protein RimM
VKTQGRQGEVAAELHTDFPERFEQRRRLFTLDAGGSRRELLLETFWPHKAQMVFKFEGIESISDAEKLIGCELQIRAADKVILEAGTEYVSDLVGCTVWDGERSLGKIIDVRFGAGEAPLLVIKGKVEYEIPYAAAFLKNVDMGRKEIHMLLPEGMLEVNAPLTAEEKEQQRSGRG